MNTCVLLCLLVAIQPSGRVIVLERGLSSGECFTKYLRENNAIVDVLEVHPTLVPPEIKCVEDE